MDVVNYIDASSSLANAVAVAEKETDTTPTEKQKEAGNYKALKVTTPILFLLNFSLLSLLAISSTMACASAWF